MNYQPEYMIGLTAFYMNGRRDYFTVRYEGFDGEMARYAAWHEFKSYNHDIECLSTHLH